MGRRKPEGERRRSRKTEKGRQERKVRKIFVEGKRGYFGLTYREKEVKDRQTRFQLRKNIKNRIENQGLEKRFLISETE